jgi:P-type Ca2+ transporter type 2C
MVVGGFWSALVNLGLFTWALGNSGRSLEEAMTMTFVSLVLIQFFKAYNFRSDRHSVLRTAVCQQVAEPGDVWEMVLLVLIVYVPFLHDRLAPSICR